VEEEKQANPNVEYKLEVSFLELYNEEIRDMLDIKKTLSIREDASGVYVAGLTEKLVNSKKEMEDMLGTIG
jgi:hypothetical protein